ncbi:MAG: hypothetical protein IJ106_01575 [Parasporobacterium sp.]|nr:hypothetical protein [Parasporobacterium sp.]
MDDGLRANYEALGNAVVIRAVKDYRMAGRRLMRHPEDRLALSEMVKLEKFFLGPDFSMFTTMDGKYLVDRLREELRKGKDR